MTILAGEMLSRLNFGYSGLIITFPLGIILGIFTGRSYYRDALKNSIKLTEDARWINLTLIGAIKKIWFILIMAFIMLIVGILFRDPLFGLLIGFITLLGFGFPIYVEEALKSNENDFPQTPNQGVYSSFTNSIRIGMFGGLFMGMIFGVQGLLIGGAFGRFFSWLITGLTIGFLKYGGMAAINHFVLRELLSRNEIIPFSLSGSRLVNILDNMSSRILLRRTGGGWVFIHRTLLEYFAALAPDA